MTYDPFGQQLAGLADNSDGNYDYGWLGSKQRGLEHEADINTIEMGARQYVPGLGRFLETDPIEGGSCNSYDYTCADPVNTFDLDGRAAGNPHCRTGDRACIKKWGKKYYGGDRSNARSFITFRAFIHVGLSIGRGGIRPRIGIGASFGVMTGSEPHSRAHHTTASGPSICLVRCFGYSKTDSINHGKYVGKDGGWGFSGWGFGVSLGGVEGD